MPTLAGFQWFITSIMGINTTVLPANDSVISWVYEQALSTVNLYISYAAPNIYTQAVYNLAGDFLLNFAQDQPGQTYFAGQRQIFHLYDFVAGVVSSTADESTDTGLEVPEQFKNFTIADLQNLKTPYGKTYLGIAQKYGTLWDIS